MTLPSRPPLYSLRESGLKATPSGAQDEVERCPPGGLGELGGTRAGLQLEGPQSTYVVAVISPPSTPLSG